MLRFFILSIFIITGLAAYSQSKSVEHINKNLASDKIEKAKSEVDALLDENPAKYPEVYLLGARVYFEIYRSKNAEIKKLDRQADNKIVELLKAYSTLSGNADTDFKQLLNTIKSEALNRADEAVTANRKKTAQSELEFVYKLSSLEGKEELNLIYNIATLAMDNNDIPRAISFYELAVERNHPDADIFLRLNELYAKSNNNENKERMMALGRKRFPDNKQIAFNEINYYMGQGNTEKLREVLQYLIDNNQDNSLYRFTLANIYENTGELSKAEKEYLLALQENPGYYDAALYLGNLYLNRAILTSEKGSAENGDYSKATTFLEMAHELAPSNTEALKSLEQLYSLTGEFEKYEKVKNKLKTL